ncbi:MAG TPA: leucine--tRNA ligase [Holosporales bacterium]|nr:leucine--tRNA ligase [Holosporales bacterium]
MAYNFRLIESKWQEFWHKNNTFKVSDPKPGEQSSYILEMLPYPSGNLHMGHVRNYAIGDAIARFQAANGFKVLHPMGWDAFGLPAENAALERGAHPEKWTLENIKTMKKQLQGLGLSYDWDREITSCMPDYYGLEQKIFIDFYKKGLAFKKESWVNWDPVENTVLANEQVVDGKGWRSGAAVERKKLNQWSLKITDYADELLTSLDTLKGWPEKVLKMQENWIGKSEGALVHFDVENMPNQKISIFTTRHDTLFGASFIAVSAHHPFVSHIKHTKALDLFIAQCNTSGTTEEELSTMEKIGFDTGFKALHPLDSSITIPIYAANFVLADYGTGAVFGCPAHDERDFDFATKYNLPILPVIETTEPLPYTGAGFIINSDFLNGKTIDAAKTEVLNRLIALKKGERQVTFRLRDWLISRQRYWGCPIPFIKCNDCGVVPVPESDLPVTLPTDVTFDKPGNPLDRHPTWKHTTCPKCQNKAERETDTFDTFFESSWYFLRYCSPHAQNPFDKEIVNSWAPVDWYIGGIEHAVLHLLYARFFVKALRDLGYLDFSEPFTNLLTQGMVCHETYKSQDNKWLYPNEIEKDRGRAFEVASRNPVTIGPSIKMSKSKRNTVDPLEILDTYGADVARLFVLSDTPPDKDFDWNVEGLDGCWRYANRLWRLVENYQDGSMIFAPSAASKESDLKLRKETHKTLKQIHDAFKTNGFNKVIALHRQLERTIEEAASTVSKDAMDEALHVLFKTIETVMPHLAAEAFTVLFKKEIQTISWPECDPKLIIDDTITIAVQVMGKLRGTFEAPLDATKEELLELARTTVCKYLNGKTIKKEIVVPKRLVSFVTD